MKTLLPALIAGILLASTSHAGWFGPGAWANATYYPGNLDGKYQAAVFGNNISGVLGFALRDASPPTTVTSQLNTTNNSSQSSLRVDPFLNYFAIFVEGRTYTGLSTANVNYNNNSVTGALIGAQPDFTLTTNSSSAFTTNSQVEAGPIIDILLPVTNVTQNIKSFGFSNAITTNYTPLTNLVTTNFTMLQTNTSVTNETFIVTNNGVVTETNIFVTNSIVTTTNITLTNEVISQPTITTNTFEVFATNFLTNVDFVTATSNTLITNPVISTLTTPYTWFDPTSLVNRGLNGGFRASINSKQSVFTFSGNGQLSTPAQTQTINFTTNARGDVVSAQIATGTVPFQLDGIRVSFSAASTSAATPSN